MKLLIAGVAAICAGVILAADQFADAVLADSVLVSNASQTAGTPPVWHRDSRSFRSNVALSHTATADPARQAA